VTKIGIPDDPKDYLEVKVKKQCVQFLESIGWKCTTIYTGGIPTSSGFLALNPAEGIFDTINYHWL